MKGVELYGRVRYAVQIEGLSHRCAAARRKFGIDPRTVAKMIEVHSARRGYVRTKPPAKPKLDPFIPVIDRVLFDDKSRPRNQQHTAKQIFEERLRDEYGFTGGLTDCEGLRRRLASARLKKMFVPLEHPPETCPGRLWRSHRRHRRRGAQRSTSSLLTCTTTRTPASWSATPPRRREAFCDGHVRAFSFFWRRSAVHPL